MPGFGRTRVFDDASTSRRRRASWSSPVSLLVVGLAATLVVGVAGPFSSPATVADASELPATLVFTQAPVGSDPGEAFAPQPEVEVLDADGEKVGTGDDAVTLTLVQAAPADDDLPLQGTLTCEDTSLTSDTGEIVYAGCKVDHGGSYQLRATLGDIVAESDLFVSGPAYLGFSPSPDTATAGTTFATAPRVTMFDGNGQAISDGDVSEVGVIVKPGTGTSGAALECAGATAPDDTTGIVKNLPTAGSEPLAYTGCEIDKSGTAYRLLAYDPTTKLIGTSDAFDVTGGVAGGLVFSRQPTGGALGGLVVQPQVTVTDAGGNPVAGETGTVTLTLTGSGPAGATLSGCTATTADGVADFTGCQLDRAGAGYTLTATHSAGRAVSDSFSIVAGGATALSFTDQPGSGAAGAALADQPVVRVVDSAGVAAAAAVTLTLKDADGASLTCAANTVRSAGGLAAFDGCAVDRVGTYKVVATAGTASVISEAFSVGEGTVHRLEFTAAPDDATGGGTFGTRPAVRVLDVGGNPAAATVALSLAPGVGTDGAVLGCDDATVNSGSDGAATFDGCDIDLAGEGYRLRATVDGVPTAIDTSEPFDVTTGAPVKLAFRTSPGDGTGGTAFPRQPVVTVEDAGGNRIVGSSAHIDIDVAPDSGPGALTCASDPAPVERGAAVLTGCSIDERGGTYRLLATAPGLSPATSDTFAVTPGPATQLLFTAQPGSGQAGQSLERQPVVRVADAGGNATTASEAPTTVSLAVTPGTGSAGGTLSCDSKGTTGGVAAFSGCSVQAAASGYTLTASAGSLRQESSPFAITPPPPGPMMQAPTSVPLEQTFGGRRYATNPTATVDGVNSASGSLVHSVLDLTVAGVGADLALERTYNSADTGSGAFGRGWTSVLDASVRLAPGTVPTKATVRGEDGQQLVFTWAAATSTWTAPPGATSTLKCSAKTCTVRRSDGISWTSEGGRITSWLEPFGRGLRFSYDATGRLTTVLVDMADPKRPRTVSVTTDLAGQVTKLVTPGGTTVGYGYSGDVLTTVTDPRGTEWTYERDGQLLSGISVGGSQRLRVAYGDAGRVVTLQRTGSPDLADLRFGWDPRTRTATRSEHVSVDGELTWVDYVDTYVGNSLVRQDFPTGAVVKYAYDTRTNLVRVQDPAGWVQEMEYDSRGNITLQRSPISATTAAVVRLTYDNDSRVLTETDANGHTVTYVYSGPGLGSITPPGGGAGATRLTYNSLGLLTAVVTPTGRQVFGYDDAGNQTRVQAETLPGTPLTGAGSAATYDEAGRVLTSTDARGTTRKVGGFTTINTYDKAGNLRTTVSPGRGTTSNTYDAAGQVISSTTPLGTTDFSWRESDFTRETTTDAGTALQTYDPSGSVLVDTSPTGHETRHRYDALGRETATVTESATVRYAFDASSNVVRIDDSDGVTTSRQFDSLNRLVRSVTDGAETLSRYDADGNLLSERDPRGNTTTRSYDSHGNLTSVTDPAGTTSYGYDLSDNVVRRTDGRGGVTTYTYDGLGHVLSQTVDGGTTTYGYDEAGNRVRTTDPSGRVTQLTLDGANRTTKREHTGAGTDSITVAQTFDVLGRRTSVKLNAGATRYFTYDDKGDLTSAQTAGGEFKYDRSTAGQVVEKYPGGTKVTYTVDDGGDLMSLTSGTGPAKVEASYIRDSEGRTTGLATSNGVLQTRSYDDDGNVAHQSLQRGGTVLTTDDYGYDRSGNRLWQRTTREDQTVIEHAYGYDTTNRLTAFARTSTSGNGPVSAPAVGTAVSESRLDTEAVPYTPVPLPAAVKPVAAPTSPTFGYDAVGNRTSPGDGTTRTYDRSGALVKSTGPAGTSVYSYDAAARLVKAVVTSGGTTRTVTYAYDADGNRIRRSVGGTETQFVWSPFGSLPLLAQELDGSGNVTKTYFNGEGPVAVRSAEATLYFALDPIGSTSAVTDEDGELVAAYEYDAFGGVRETGTTAAAVDLLFQGQQLDRVTGLYNMRARSYDPASGRFTQREPLETAVGTPYVSAYAFVGNRPTARTDPTGLAPEITATTIFAGQSTAEANSASQAKMAATATKLTLTGVSKLSYFSGAASRAAAAGVESSKAMKFATALKVVGHGLTVAGIALQTYMAIENCKYGSVQKCVGSATGLAINVAFTIGCSTITAGAGSVGGCAMVGAILSIAVEFVIAQYGPEIAAGVIEVAGIVGTFVSDVALSIDLAFADAGGAIASGFNDAVSALSTGYAEALATLTDAGLTVVQLAEVLSGTFELGYRETVAGVLALGYDIAAAAVALDEVLGLGLSDAAAVLRHEFDAAATEVGAALKGAYADSELALVQALDEAGYAVDEVVSTMEAVYGQTFAGLVDLLDDAGYTASQIAAAAQDVFDETDRVVAAALQELGVGVEQLAVVLRDICAQADAAVANTLADIGYSATVVADALEAAFNDSAAVAAELLAGAAFAADEVAAALRSAYGASAQLAAQLLRDADFAVGEVATALSDAYLQSAAQAAALLQGAGYLADDIAIGLEDAYEQTANEVATILAGLDYTATEVAGALDEVFALADDAIAGILDDLAYTDAQVAAALQLALDLTTAEVTAALEELGYTASQLGSVLLGVFGQTAAQTAQLLEDVNYSFAEIGTVLDDVFAQGAAEAAGILQDVGALATDVSSILQSTFGQSDAVIAGLLDDAGYAIGEIEALGGAIGGALESAATEVADWFDSWW